MKEIAYKIIELNNKSNNDFLTDLNRVLSRYLRYREEVITLYQKAIDFELVDKLLQLHLSSDIDNLSPWQELLLFDFNIYLPDDHTDELFACFDMLIRVCYGVNLKMEDVVYDNFNYHGPIFFGQGTGNCKIAYHDGSTYVGDIINGKCNG